MPRAKKETSSTPDGLSRDQATIMGSSLGNMVPVPPQAPTTPAIDAALVKQLADKIAQLEQKDAENQKQLTMLREVADKGRVYNYENQRSGKQAMRVKLSRFQNGIIVAWRTLKDELVKHPTTGLTVGEVQEYELVIQGNDGQLSKVTVNGYPAFTTARCSERIEAEVVGTKTDFQGNTTFEVQLPGGQKINMDAKFVN